MTLNVGLNVGHDSGASLISGDEVVCSVNEERFSRIKGHVGFPEQSLNYFVEKYSDLFSDPKQVTVNIEGLKFLPWQKTTEDMQPMNLPLVRKCLDYSRISDFLLGTRSGLTLSTQLMKVQQLGYKSSLEKRVSSIFGYKEVHYVDHHRAHAASALPFVDQSDESGLSISFDAAGEGICSRTHIVDSNGNLFESTELALPCLHSPASFYAAVTEICGFKANRHEGKITGLAAHGDGYAVQAILKSFLKTHDSWPFISNKIGYGAAQLGKLRKSLRDFSKEDIAAGIQRLTEESVIHYITRVDNSLTRERQSTVKYKNLYLSGGLFANVSLNRRVQELNLSERIVIAPNMGDGGLSLGAAVIGSRRSGVNAKNPKLGLPYLGPDIEKTLGTTADPTVIATLLSQNKIMALCKGRMEFGPRALGNRSIIFPAWDRSINQWLNKKLNRSEFMPFAPIVRDVDFEKYFILRPAMSIRDYRFMTLTVGCTELAAKEVPGVVHIDNSARPQVVYEEDNQFLYSILTEFEKLTGCGVLINTSFNMHEEPIVMSAVQGKESFAASGIDYLVLSDIMRT